MTQTDHAPKAQRRRTGRRAGNPDTRQDILASARSLFAEEGYASATLRKIAQRAKVDVALVIHYFGSKDDLFGESIAFPNRYRDDIRKAFEGPIEQVGERIVRAYLRLWEAPEVAVSLLSIVRSAFSGGRAGVLATEQLETRILHEFSTTLMGEDEAGNRARVGAVLVILLGLALGRYVFCVGPLADLDCDGVVAIVAPAVQEVITPRTQVCPDQNL